FVDMVHAAMTNDKIEIWNELRFNLLFKGDDWRGTEKGEKLERDFATLGVDVVYFPYTPATSSSALRRTLQNIDAIADRAITAARHPEAGIGYLPVNTTGIMGCPPGPASVPAAGQKQGSECEARAAAAPLVKLLYSRG